MLLREPFFWRTLYINITKKSNIHQQQYVKHCNSITNFHFVGSGLPKHDRAPQHSVSATTLVTPLLTPLL